MNKDHVKREPTPYGLKKKELNGRLMMYNNLTNNDKQMALLDQLIAVVNVGIKEELKF